MKSSYFDHNLIFVFNTVDSNVEVSFDRTLEVLHTCSPASLLINPCPIRMEGYSTSTVYIVHTLLYCMYAYQLVQCTYVQYVHYSFLTQLCPPFTLQYSTRPSGQKHIKSVNFTYGKNSHVSCVCVCIIYGAGSL